MKRLSSFPYHESVCKITLNRLSVARGTGEQPSWRRLERRLDPAVDTTTPEREGLRQLTLVSFLAPATFLVWGAMYGIVYGSSVAFIALTGVAIACSAVPLVLRAGGSLVLAGHLLGATCLGGLVVVSWLRGGFQLSVLMWTLLVPMCAALVAPRRSQIALWTLASIGVTVAFLVLDQLGRAPNPAIVLDPGSRAIHEAGALITLVVFVLVAARSAAAIQRALGSERDALSRQLEQAGRLDAIGQLTSGVAHDFGNLLAGVQAAAELVQRRIDAHDPAYRDLEIILSCTERGTRLTRQLLSFVRNDPSLAETVHLSRTVRDMAALVARVVSRIEVRVEADDELEPVCIDPGQLDRVVLNLALNARDAMPRGGTLTLRARRRTIRPDDIRFAGLAPGPWCSLEVADTGCGMDDATLARIFEPYYSTKASGHGAGLGLSTCADIVTRAGGEIVAESEPNQGTTFYVLLPPAGRRPRRPPTPEPGIVVVDHSGTSAARPAKLPS